MNDFSYSIADNPWFLYIENMSLSPKTLNIERDVFDFFLACSDIGGVLSVFVYIVGLFMVPYNTFHF